MMSDKSKSKRPCAMNQVKQGDHSKALVDQIKNKLKDHSVSAITVQSWFSTK